MRHTFIYMVAAAALSIACSQLDDKVDDDKNTFPEVKSPPVVQILIENEGEINSKEEYVNVDVRMAEGSKTVFVASGRAKGRGNATWNKYPKKPYKLKFDEKQIMLGQTAFKDWVLLADYCDRSLLRTAYMCELSAIAGLNYPIRYQHVQLYLNREYAGLYILTDQVEKKVGRVDIADNGFLFENDRYYSSEPLYFKTNIKKYNYTFKHPDPEDGEIASGDESFNFIKGFMDDFENALYGNNFKDEKKGYRKYIDTRSFAKWFLVMELTGNYEPNMYYVLPSRQDKLRIGPAWDAEWSMGLAHKSDETAKWSSPPVEPDSEQEIWTKWQYMGRLFEDPYFVNIVKEEWEKLKPLLPAYRARIASVAKSLSEYQTQNFIKWDILNDFISVDLVYFGSWEAEVQYAADFFDKRVRHVESILYQDVLSHVTLTKP